VDFLLAFQEIDNFSGVASPPPLEVLVWRLINEPKDEPFFFSRSILSRSPKHADNRNLDSKFDVHTLIS